MAQRQDELRLPPPPDDSSEATPWAEPLDDGWDEWIVASETPATRPEQRSRRLFTTVVVVAALVLGVVAGRATRQSDVDDLRARLRSTNADLSAVLAREVQLTEELATASDRITALERDLADIQDRADAAEARADTAVKNARTRVEKEMADDRAKAEAEIAAARKQAEEDDAARSAELDARQAALDEREAVIARAEDVAARSTFGSGVYVVGVDVPAGRYRGKGRPGCYWARVSGDGGGIIEDHVQSGPGPVVANLAEGELFESSQCGTWTRM